MKKTFMFMLVSLFLLVTACGKNEYKAVAIDEKVDKCALCNMMVEDNQFATELITEDGQVKKFDDLGCLHKWEEEHSNTKIDAKYVRDFHTKEWLMLDEATYVYDQSFATPMGYGIYAFKSKEEAQSFVDQEGKGMLLTANDFNTHDWGSNMGMHEDTSEEMGDTSEEMGDTSEEMGDTSEEMGDTSEEMGDTSEEMGDTSEEMGDTSGEMHS